MARARKKAKAKSEKNKPDIVLSNEDFDDDDYLDISFVFIIRDILIGLLLFGTLLAPFMAYVYMKYDDDGSCAASLDDAIYEDAVPLLDASDNFSHIPASPKIPYQRWDIECSNSYEPSLPQSCVPKRCGRALLDSFITPTQVLELRNIAEKGMAGRDDSGGPTIMDINSGFVKDGAGLTNIYYNKSNSAPRRIFTSEEYLLYKNVVEKVRLAQRHGSV